MRWRIVNGINVPEGGLPPMPVRAANLAAAVKRTVVRALKGEKVIVPPDIEAARLAQCHACPHHKNHHCRLCGCPTRGWIKNKVKLAGEKCPDKPPHWTEYG